MAAFLSSSLNALPGVWQGDAWAHAPQPALATGHAPLDAQLPGGGWPLGCMSELLLPPQAHPEWTLVMPALAAHLAQGPGHAVLVTPPLEPFLPALQPVGLTADRLCCIHPSSPRADMAAAWACEQALRCRDVRAVLAWLPQVPAAVLRRLQLAAAQHRQLLWVMRPERSRAQASPAPLRLWLQPQGEELHVHVVKRRGPPLAQPVALPARTPVLAAALQAQAQWRRQVQAAAWGMGGRTPQEVEDALACLALATH